MQEGLIWLSGVLISFWLVGVAVMQLTGRSTAEAEGSEWYRSDLAPRSRVEGIWIAVIYPIVLPLALILLVIGALVASVVGFARRTWHTLTRYRLHRPNNRGG